MKKIIEIVEDDFQVSIRIDSFLFDEKGNLVGQINKNGEKKYFKTLLK